jgi:signal transduction histidine kinase
LTLELPSSPLIVEGDAVRLAQGVREPAQQCGEVHGRRRAASKSSSVVKTMSRVISVRDNGSGISCEMLPHVFELFVQGGNPPIALRAGSASA